MGIMSMYKAGRPSKHFTGKQAGKMLPNRPGEYRIRNQNGIITYLGETNNLLRRANEHRRSGKLSGDGSFEYKIADGRSTSVTRRVHERQQISRHNPVMNKSKGGEGRVAK